MTTSNHFLLEPLIYHSTTSVDLHFDLEIKIKDSRQCRGMHTQSIDDYFHQNIRAHDFEGILLDCPKFYGPKIM